MTFHALVMAIVTVPDIAAIGIKFKDKGARVRRLLAIKHIKDTLHCSDCAVMLRKERENARP